MYFFFRNGSFKLPLLISLSKFLISLLSATLPLHSVRRAFVYEHSSRICIFLIRREHTSDQNVAAPLIRTVGRGRVLKRAANRA